MSNKNNVVTLKRLLALLVTVDTTNVKVEVKGLYKKAKDRHPLGYMLNI